MSLFAFGCNWRDLFFAQRFFFTLQFACKFVSGPVTTQGLEWRVLGSSPVSFTRAFHPNMPWTTFREVVPAGIIPDVSYVTGKSACPAGMYSTVGLSACLNCSCLVGLYCPARASSCVACPVGAFCDGGRAAPIFCAAGTYAASASAGRCSACPVGSFCPTDAFAFSSDNLVLSLDARTANRPGSTWVDDSGFDNSGWLQNGPMLTSTATGNSLSFYTFNGISQHVTTSLLITTPQVFSLVVVFRTTKANGTKLIGFESAQKGTSSYADRQIWVGLDGCSARLTLSKVVSLLRQSRASERRAPSRLCLAYFATS
jgi:hypothetical protein